MADCFLTVGAQSVSDDQYLETSPDSPVRQIRASYLFSVTTALDHQTSFEYHTTAYLSFCQAFLR